ncbi:MAG: hypothetical protein WD733_18700 [Bryobacterales bacterium]
MNRTFVSFVVLFFALAGSVVAENPVHDREAPKEAVENSGGEKAVPESSLGEFTWPGKLVDQDCKDKRIDNTCPVSPSTVRFGLVIDGGIILPFDEASNQKTKEFVAKRGQKGNLEVLADGSREGGAFKLQSIKSAK